MYLSCEVKNALMNTGAKVLFDEPMKKYTSFKTGGNADAFVSVKNEDEIKKTAGICKNESIPLTVIGNGTNLLVSDGGIRGVVLHIGREMADVHVQGKKIYAMAGASLGKVSAAAQENSLTGFERLGGIPGNVGGGVYMNAGAYDAELSRVLCEVSYVDMNGNCGVYGKEEYAGGYRKSVFTNSDKIITGAVFELEYGDKDKIRAEIEEYTKRRNDKQPLTFPSAGSTFKRPEGHFAGALIEKANLKGCMIGGAQVSEKHAGFVINTGDATSDDVYRLIEHIKKVVFEKFGIMLECEVKFLGEF